MSTLSSPRSLALLVARLGLAGSSLAGVALGQGGQAPGGVLPVGQIGPVPLPTFEAWMFRGADLREMTWGFHLHYEDPGYPIRVLAHDFVDLPDDAYPVGAPTDYLDLLVLNRPQYLPPEGVPLEPGEQRLLALGSISHRGMQLLVNYSGSYKDADPANDPFLEPTFFAATELGGRPEKENTQVDPPVASTGMTDNEPFDPWENVAASGGAVGSYYDKEGNALAAVYVTASLGLPASEFDPNHLGAIGPVDRDRLVVETSPGVWIDLVVADDAAQTALYLGAQTDLRNAAAGSSGGVAFGDFDDDGQVDDLYVGKTGEELEGAPDVLLINEAGVFVDRSDWIDVVPDGCAAEVMAGQLDGNFGWDVAVANRVGSGDGSESDDWIVGSLGAGAMHAERIDAGTGRNTLSVAIGELGDLAGVAGKLEVVFADAGPTPFSDAPLLPGGTLRVHRFDPTIPGFVGVDGGSLALPADLQAGTRPFTRQVLIADLFTPEAVATAQGTDLREPDGIADIVVVNGRDALKHDWSTDPLHQPEVASSNVAFFTNTGAANPTPAAPLFELSRSGGEEFTLDSPWTTCVALADLSPVNDGLDLFHGRGSRFNGVMPHFTRNLGADAPPFTVTPWDLTPTFQNHLRYDLLPGTEHGYGLDFADYDRDGRLDAVQTSRGYNYLVNAVSGTGGHYEQSHRELTHRALSPFITRNDRGRLIARAGEDGAFADFDRDGDLDLALVVQREHSPGFEELQNDPPGAVQYDSSPDTLILENAVHAPLAGEVADEHSPFTFEKEYVVGHLVGDRKVDLSGRDGITPSLADRVWAADFDNDRDVDLFVRLGDTKNVPIGGPYKVAGPLPGAADNSVGFRYLRNVFDESTTGRWFEDVADERMLDLDPGAGPQGTWAFSDDWNRLVASEVVADFDNNGALDVFSASGRAMFARLDENGAVQSDIPLPLMNVATVEQATDLLFLNGLDETGADDPAAVGTLRELGDYGQVGALLDYVSEDIVADELDLNGAPVTRDTGGIWGVAVGDIDNDGDADLVGAHHRFGTLVNHPLLLVNQLDSEGQPRFQDEWHSRVGPLDGDVIKSVVEPISGKVMDDAMWPALFDFDGDGDLDLVFQVVNDLPRFLRNTGWDANKDGLLSPADGAHAPGHFEDVTDEILGAIRKPTVDSQELVAVDIDLDGDLDLVNDPFFDLVTVWRNDRASSSRPVVTEIWPRIGYAPSASEPGHPLRLYGANLGDVNRIQLRFQDGTNEKLNIDTFTPGTDGARAYLEFDLPYDADPNRRGLALVRLRSNSGAGNKWSTQYFGYHVLGMP